MCGSSYLEKSAKVMKFDGGWRVATLDLLSLTTIVVAKFVLKRNFTLHNKIHLQTNINVFV